MQKILLRWAAIKPGGGDLVNIPPARAEGSFFLGGLIPEGFPVALVELVHIHAFFLRVE